MARGQTIEIGEALHPITFIVGSEASDKERELFRVKFGTNNPEVVIVGLQWEDREEDHQVKTLTERVAGPILEALRDGKNVRVLYTLDCLHLLELRRFWREAVTAARGAGSQLLVVTNRNPVIVACSDYEAFQEEDPSLVTMMNTHFELYRGCEQEKPEDRRRYYRYSGRMVYNMYEAIAADLTLSP
jgi:hypothetical protein